MARRRKPDEPEEGDHRNGVAVADPPSNEPPANSEGNGTAPAEPPKSRPVASFAANSDRTTRIEVAVWARVVKVSDQEEYTQHSLTTSRSWRDKEGKWMNNGFFRPHDVPVLLYLIREAYHWCLARRTHVHVESPEELPF